MKWTFLIVFFLGVLGFFSCDNDSRKSPMEPSEQTVEKNNISGKITGASLEMPREAIDSSDFSEIKKMNIEWVAVIPYGVTRKNTSTVDYNYKYQWWGERREGVIKTIKIAQKKGVKVMMKPHVWVSGEGWAGEFKCETEREWKIWENSYQDYILKFARIADSMNVELFCIGTEYRIAATKRPKFWKSLIDTVRTVYRNSLTYAANWDNYQKISFWNELDYIGIDAYFPVTQTPKPSKETIKKGFEEVSGYIKKLSDSCKREVLFTEYGFRSIDYSTSGYYKYEADELSVNPKLQADAYAAFFETFWEKNWVKGGFFWKYHFLSEDKLGGLKNKRYTPQFKPAQETIRKAYRK